MSVRQSFCYQLVKMFITLEPHVIYLSHLHTYACQHSLTTGMPAHPFLIDMGLMSNCLACCSQLVKVRKTLEPYRIFGLNFANLLIFILFIHPGIQNGGESLLRIIWPATSYEYYYLPSIYL